MFQTLIVNAAPEISKATEAAKESLPETGILGLDIGQTIFYIICFVATMVVLNKVLFSKIAKILDDRQALLEKTAAEHDELTEKLANINSQAKQITDEAKASARKIIDDAKLEAEPAKNKVLSEAQEIAQGIVTSANNESTKIIAGAKSNAESEAGKIVVEAIKKSASNLQLSPELQSQISSQIITKL
jgi:F-type H+-transporting ATPase subunit b